MKRIAIYCRVSTDDQTTDNQEQVLTNWANAAGEVVQVFKDTVSGSVPLAKRKAGKALLAAVAKRQVDQVAVFSTCRIGRSLSDLVATLETLRATDTDLYIETQALDTCTPFGRAMFGMVAVFAEFEREMIRERVKAGMQRAKASGKHCGRPRITPAQESHIRELFAAGNGIRKTATLAGVGTGTVQRVLKGAT